MESSGEDGTEDEYRPHMRTVGINSEIINSIESFCEFKVYYFKVNDIQQRNILLTSSCLEY